MTRRASTKENAWQAFRRGDSAVRLSAIWWGAGCMARGQVGKAVLLCLQEAAFLLGIVLTWPFLMKLPTLGTVQAERIWDPVSRRNVWNDYDNSFLILLFGVVGLLLIATFVLQCVRMVKHARRIQLLAKPLKLLALLDQHLQQLTAAQPFKLFIRHTCLPCLS